MIAMQLSLFDIKPLEERIAEFFLKEFKWEEQYYHEKMDLMKWIRWKFRHREEGNYTLEGFSWARFRPGWFELEDGNHAVAFRLSEEKLCDLLAKARTADA